jgi:hypothetical protein
MNEALNAKLSEFFGQYAFNRKGPLSVALHITRYAIENGLPIDAEKLKTVSKGQVKGLK